MKVTRIDERLNALAYPSLVSVETPELNEGDVLLMCAGFEERAVEVLRRAVLGGRRGFAVICVDYLPAVSANQNAEVEHLCQAAGAALRMIQFDREQPAGAARAILDLVPGASRLTIDLSGMSRLLIVQLIASIIREGRVALSEVLYCTAQTYPPSPEEVAAKMEELSDLIDVTMFVSSGIFGLTIVPELSTVAMQGQPIRLVAFPSWNITQFATVCAEMQASYFTIVHGIPPRSENAWRRDAIRTLNRVDSLPPRDEVDASTLDYSETVRLLLKVYSEHGQREKLVISPTGSKMQSLAVGLVCGFLRDLQVVYPTPRTFAAPSDYTRGVGDLFRLSLAGFASLGREDLSADLRATA